ncbi:hypothetical protein L3556_14995 [Candidatus Synechococcus calcipolaris G9]|uniref:Uncharacterized protein n=1 Tax=Candidatus Synechococcus calcipolaris G9 TaxID=1497997 RepID=A0ABT6F341_9SYNE|nr:hypothetical protein [Candidatus Synechococcus calcipolaris]MDG2992225.1 hypothetical protein [Candidatus Synechococcus calcipolaris G9]
MKLLDAIRRILATRLITPSQERQINQLLWTSELGPYEYDALEQLVDGLSSGQIVVLSQLERAVSHVVSPA